MIRRLGALLFGIVVAVLVPAGTASAHAELLDVSPADGAVLTEAPAEAVLRFSEQVSLTGGSAAVLDDTGAPVSAAPSVVDVNVVIPLDGGLGDGTYTIVVERDLRPTRTASAGRRCSTSGRRPPAAPSTSPAAGAPAGGCGSPPRCSPPSAYAGALVSVGGWWFTMLVVRRAPDPRWAMVIDRAAILAVSALIAAIPMRIARLGGGMGALARR